MNEREREREREREVVFYNFSSVKETSETDYGTLDVHGKNGEIKDIPLQFTLEFWMKSKFNPENKTKKEIFGMYLYDNENVSVSKYNDIPNGQELKLEDIDGITPYINIYINENNNYIFTINNLETEIPKYKIDNEWNHIALTYDKLNNTSCIWYLNGIPILGSNISNNNMQEIINKKFCRFLWTMYKNDNYVYIYKIHLIENNDAEFNTGIKYSKHFNHYDHKYIIPGENIHAVLNNYNSMIIKPKPSHTKYDSYVYLPMQESETEDLGNNTFTWINNNTYSSRNEYDIADILINDAYNRISDIVELKNFKCDDRDPIEIYGYDPDYRIDMGNAVALHQYSNLECDTGINFSSLDEGFTIDWFSAAISKNQIIYHNSNTDFSSLYNNIIKLIINNPDLLNEDNTFDPSSISGNTTTDISYEKNTQFAHLEKATFSCDNYIKLSGIKHDNSKINPTSLFLQDIFDNYKNTYINTNKYDDSRSYLYKYLSNISNKINHYNNYDYFYKMYNPYQYYNYMIHHALVVKPGGKILYFKNGNKIDINIHDISLTQNDDIILSFFRGDDYVYYPNIGNYNSPFSYIAHPDNNGQYLKLNDTTTNSTTNFPNSVEALLEAFERVKINRHSAFDVYTHLDDLIPENGTSSEQQAYKNMKYLREINGIKSNYSSDNIKCTYYNYFTFKNPNIFNHFRITPNCLWYDNSFDLLTDTRLFVQDWDIKYNQPEQVISDIEEDNIALLYPINSPNTVYDRRYSISANVRKDSTIQKSNFQVEPISPDPSNLIYDTEITQQGTHKPVKYESYPAITTNTYKDNNNVIVFRNHHIEDKSWTVDLWVYPKLQIESGYNTANWQKLLYLSGFGNNDDITLEEYFKHGNGMIGLDIHNNNIAYIISNSGDKLQWDGWSLSNKYVAQHIFDNNANYVFDPTFNVVKMCNNIFNFNSWNHIAISSDISAHTLSIYINSNRIYIDPNRRFSQLHRLFLYTSTTDGCIRPYYTGLKVTIGESKYNEDTISGWENC